MGGDEHSIWAGLQGNFQQVPAVQPQDRPSIGVDIADGFQLVGEDIRRL